MIDLKFNTTQSYVKWVINGYKGSDEVAICRTGTDKGYINFKYNYLKKLYIIETDNFSYEYKNRLTALNNFKEMEFNLLNSK